MPTQRENPKVPALRKDSPVFKIMYFSTPHGIISN